MCVSGGRGAEESEGLSSLRCRDLRPPFREGCLVYGVVLSDSLMAVPGNGGLREHVVCFCVPVFQGSPGPSLAPLVFGRRFLNRSSEDDSASESCLPSEGTTSDPVTLRRRMLAAAAERRLQKQQTS